MAWLHTWAGLLLGWLLYFMFLTGTAGYFDTEIDYWMRPEIPQRAAFPPAATSIAFALRRVEEQAPDAQRFILYPPNRRDVPELSLFWSRPPGSSGGPSSKNEVLDRTTGAPIAARATGGGAALYEMHYALRYMPSTAAYWIVGAATMFMLVAILSGVITHKKIFSHFFTFRPRKGQRSWLDAHNALSVAALPFHLLITYSGFVFFCFMYMPLVIAGSYGAGGANRQQFIDEVFTRPGSTPARAGVPAPLASLEAMAREAERRWGDGEIRSIDVRNPGDANARVTFTRAHVTPTSNGERLDFDGVSGALLPGSPAARSGPMLVNDTLMSLHEGLFAGPALRWLYFFAGILGTAMIGTGLVLWTAKRRRQSDGPHAGLELVEHLNIGTIVGLPSAVAVYFLANRLLPLDLAARANWEINALFLAWAATFLYPLLRPRRRAWLELLALAAALFAAIPAVNALTTDRHLGVSLPAGDWVLAGFDLAMLALGAGFGAAAYRLRKPAHAPATAGAQVGRASTDPA
jgi:uncharacterized iron-regulated membrane protein